MSISSISISRHLHLHLPNIFNPSSFFSLQKLRFLTIVTARRQDPNPYRKLHQSNPKLLLQSREKTSSLSPILSPSNPPPILLHNQAIGMVASSQANFMRVLIQNPNPNDPANPNPRVELLCVVKAVLKKIKRRVLVGDKVLVGAIDWVDKRGMIENVFQRSCEISDPPVANVDQLLVLFSMEQPKVEEFSLTRFLIEAESTGIPLTLALNKCELVDEETEIAWKTKLRSWGYQPVFCSVESRIGLDSLEFILREQTSVIVGPSGVGKSSLINALRSNKKVVSEEEKWFASVEGGKWFDNQRVGEVSIRSGRGKHTTRHVSLLPLSGGGYLADTPGFNQPSLMKVTKKSLAQMFPEIRKVLNDAEGTKCTFSDCLHLGEPGCVVNGDWERYPYYLQLLDEIKIREEFQLRTFGSKRESDVRYKVGDMGVKQAEPRLELKKHRRQSRKRTNQSIIEELDDLEDDDDEIMTIADDETSLEAARVVNNDKH
ncbi:thiamine phosphate phosphatase [Ranunculus cassubicifolius]